MKRLLLSFAFILLSAIMAQGADVRDSVLIIPGGTVRIRNYEFTDRTDFHSIRFESPVHLTEIGDFAFMGCSNLRNIHLPGSTVTLGQGAFRECTSLRNAEIPGVKVIPRECFRDCPELNSIILSSRCSDIAAHAFAYCSSLQSIRIPSGVTHIGSNAFSFCSSLVEVYLPPSVKELESYAFSECTSLRKAILPANRNLLGEYIFSGCRVLESIGEPSPVPPTFDCGSPLFEEGDKEIYSTCRLIVPTRSIETYRNTSPWNLFDNIIGRDI